MPPASRNHNAGISENIFLGGLAVYYLTLFYAPLSLSLTFLFRARDFSGGALSTWSGGLWRIYDFKALFFALAWSTALCAPALIMAVAGGTALATHMEMELPPKHRRIFFSLLVGLVAGDGLLKAISYRISFALSPSPATFILLSIFMLLPLSTIVISLGFRRLDSSLLTAARDLGVSRWVQAVGVLIPANRKAIQSATALSCILLFFNLVYAEVFLGNKHFVMATLIKHQFLENADWPASILTMLAGFLILAITAFFFSNSRAGQGGDWQWRC